MISFEAWLVFLPTAVLLSLGPGPSNLLALTNGLRYGLRPSVLAALGRLAAFAVMILLTALGLAAAAVVLGAVLLAAGGLRLRVATSGGNA